MRPLRVLHVVPSLAARTGGPAVSVVESSLALTDHGISSAVATTDLAAIASKSKHYPVDPSAFPPGAEKLPLTIYATHFPRRLAFTPSMLSALMRNARLFDVVHIHSLWLFPQFAAFASAQLRGVPFIVSPRGSLDPWLRRRGRVRKRITMDVWQGAMLRNARFLHVTSVTEGALIRDISPATPRAVVPNGVSTARFSLLPSAALQRRRWLPQGDGVIVLTIGRLTAKKNLETLVRAFAEATRRVRAPAALVIAGPDDEGLATSLREIARIEGVLEQVHFPGMLSGSAKLEALAAADIWALPSYTENFGVAAVEALAAGRATVLSRAINIAEDAGSADAALVVDPTLEDFTEAIALLMRDEDRRRRLGEAARRYAQRYDWAAVSPMLAEMYRSAASSNADSSSRHECAVSSP